MKSLLDAYAIALQGSGQATPAPSFIEGPNPTATATLGFHDVDNERRDCARTSYCAGYAGKRGWASYSCSYCAIREPVEREIQTRRGTSESVAFPDVRR